MSGKELTMDKSKYQILTVDDFVSMRRIIKNQLSEMGFQQVLEAENGQMAWQVLESNRIDIIISDWNMPKMTGLELLKMVRADDRFKDIPFLMVTAESDKDSVVQAVKANVTNYILKPFTPDKFKQKVDQVMENMKV
jgi:two-component system, chemotaxis family, chemotaxis protein CheY